VLSNGDSSGKLQRNELPIGDGLPIGGRQPIGMLGVRAGDEKPSGISDGAYEGSQKLVTKKRVTKTRHKKTRHKKHVTQNASQK
jgi:hypothetical protein